MPIDYKNYPRNWKTEIRPRIMQRAGNKCEQCGLPNEAYVFTVTLKIQDDSDGRYKPKSLWFSDRGDAMRAAKFDESNVKPCKVVITIAHLDHDETNHLVTDDRLMAMCQICHLNYDAKEKYRRQQNGNKTPLNPIKKAI